jgi:hypothetical protein
MARLFLVVHVLVFIVVGAWFVEVATDSVHDEEEEPQPQQHQDHDHYGL